VRGYNLKFQVRTRHVKFQVNLSVEISIINVKITGKAYSVLGKENASLGFLAEHKNSKTVENI